MKEYLIWSVEHNAWWRANQWGYSPRLADAGQYSKEEAQKIVKSANVGSFNECMIPVEFVRREEADSAALAHRIALAIIKKHPAVNVNSDVLLMTIASALPATKPDTQPAMPGVCGDCARNQSACARPGVLDCGSYKAQQAGA